MGSCQIIKQCYKKQAEYEEYVDDENNSFDRDLNTAAFPQKDIVLYLKAVGFKKKIGLYRFIDNEKPMWFYEELARGPIGEDWPKG